MGDGKLLELAEYTVRGRLTVRVPSANTQAFLRAIVGQMAFLDRRNFDAMDAQFQLLRQQLAYQRSQEAQQDLGQAAQQDGRIDRKADVIQARSDAKSARDEASDRAEGIRGPRRPSAPSTCRCTRRRRSARPN